MNRQLRRLTFLRFRLLFPPQERFSNEIAELLPRLREHYPFEHYHQEGDLRAVVETEGRKRIEFERDRLTYQEQVREDFTVVTKNALSLMELVFMHFEVRVNLTTHVDLRQRWPLDADAGKAGEALQEHSLKIETGQLEPLGELEGTGLMLAGTQQDPFMHWHLEIEPVESDDANELYMEFGGMFAESSEGTEGLGTCLATAHGFLEDNVAQFIEGFMP